MRQAIEEFLNAKTNNTWLAQDLMDALSNIYIESDRNDRPIRIIWNDLNYSMELENEAVPNKG